MDALCILVIVKSMQISADVCLLSCVPAFIKPLNFRNRFLYYEGEGSSLRNVVSEAQTVHSVQNISQSVHIVVRSCQTYLTSCVRYHIMAVRILNCKKQLLARLQIARVWLQCRH